MSLLIQHNMLAWNAERQFNITTKAKAKKTEKLSSGYRINRAADDAAGLSISEKMRRQIRGLQVGTENAQMGVSWVQIGEGALNEAHDILHRMNELTIKAQNGTNTATDRAYMQAEFEQLQSELDRISTTTTFNELNIFEEHEPVYDQICGNKRWDYEELHEIESGRNQLIIEYRDSLDSQQKTVTLTVPPGKYTTHELIDELDSSAGILGPIHMEYTESGFCSVNLEGGERIDTIKGDLAYLLWDTYDGGGYGALIGTTSYPSEADTLKVVQGKNDYMEFIIEYFDGSGTETVELDLLDDNDPALPSGTEVRFSKTQLINLIDEKIAQKAPNSGLKANHHGDSIMLSSDKGIVTGFKGNMFKIENADPIYTSVFYDNIQEGYVWQDPAAVVGGAVLTTDSRDEEHSRFYINSTNNKLVLQPNLTTTPVEIEITVKPADLNDPKNEGYTAQQMVDELNAQFVNKGIDGEVKAYLVQSEKRKPFADGKNPGAATADTENVGDDWVVFEGVEIRTVKEGPDAIVNIDRNASTAYDTLFTIKNYNFYGKNTVTNTAAANATDAKVDNETTKDKNAYAESSRTYLSSDKVAIKNGVNDRFALTLKSTSARNANSTADYNKTFTIDISDTNKDMTASDIVNAINNQINNNASLSELKGRVEAVFDSGKIRILDKEDKTLDNVADQYLNWNTTIELSSVGGNTGYRTIFEEPYQYYVQYTSSGKGSLTLDTGGQAPPFGSGMWVNINGTDEYFDFKGANSLAGIKSAIDTATPIKFTSISDTGSANGKTVMMNGTGNTSITYWAGGTAVGTSKEKQGASGFEYNAPAELAIGPLLNNSMTVNSSNNKITLRLNGVEKTLTLDDGTYNQAGLAANLQKQINKSLAQGGFGTGMGGASVDVVNNQLVITSNLPRGEDGKKTSITAFARGERTNTFFDSLNKVETAATAVSSLSIADNIALQNGVNDSFSFSYRDSTGSHTVTIDLATTDETINRDTFLQRIQTGLNNAANNDDGSAIGVMAVLDASNRLVLTTKEKGNGTSVSYTANSTNPNADVVFGGLSNPTAARIVLDKNVQASSASGGEFIFYLDGVEEKKVTIGGWNNSTSNTLAKVLNDQFNAQSIDVTASLEGGKLCLTRKTTGSGSISMNYNSGGSVMPKIFGYEPKPGVTVSVSGNQLTIKGGANDVISVNSTESGGTLAPKKATAYRPAVEVGGFHSAKFSMVTSTELDAGGIELTRWNNELKFKFTQDGAATWKDVAFRLTESGAGNKTSLADIKTELQTKIDAELGSGVVEVLLDSTTNKLSLKSAKPGEQFRFSGLGSTASAKTGGGFFHHVMCGYTLKKNKLDDREDINGEQYAGDIFAQGRHNVVTELTKLKPGVSDTLVLDLTYIPDENHDGRLDGTEEKKQATITLEMKLDANMREEDFYDAESLKKMIQKKLNESISSTEVQEQAKKLGIELHENLIEVDVGRHQTNIWGNKDSVSISFTMTRDHDIATPVEGYFYIDGIRGNAAYETFYHTEGELIPAYIIGTKNVNNGVVLGKDDTELTFMVDDEQKTVKLKPGKYTAEGIVDAITKAFEDQDIPLAAEVTKKGFLKISHKRMGRHLIEKVTGSARNELFFEEYAEKRPAREREIRISSFEGDRLAVYSPRFSTTMLHINSICISQIKYAEKATERLKEAINLVSDMRNTFGAIQNRFEHTINNNRNKEENLQAAETRIRDADISTEMMEFSNLSIIQQAGQAVLAQANQSREGMLSLLG